MVLLYSTPFPLSIQDARVKEAEDHGFFPKKIKCACIDLGRIQGVGKVAGRLLVGLRMMLFCEKNKKTQRSWGRGRLQKQISSRIASFDLRLFRRERQPCVCHQDVHTQIYICVFFCVITIPRCFIERRIEIDGVRTVVSMYIYVYFIFFQTLLNNL